ncbi:uncharacterized protein N7479_008843 [Penicillium vulpinum]|uniref:Aminoglycoside phosphotransferase domain-containing protein n=1 Tax=Penicillium vulpinum TaxID=29845 RepID=A0A1V6S251_9EURO|nr:uncharacterized protein N7479_008843 [Penicillium vulpinum]KAJ5950430.1 hypothetical protein N7479_008843 [Penicillium vulpinum]OQE07703.1 hypothetical protein PENVUL_c012G02098 [Penicillium vulpinum]
MAIHFFIATVAMQMTPTKDQQPLSMAAPQQKSSRPERKRPDHPPHESTTRHLLNARKWTVLQTSIGGRSVKKSASLGTKYERGMVCEFHPDSFAALRREYSVLSIISQIPSPIGHPRIISADFESGVLVLACPKVYWTPLWRRVNEPALDLDSLLQMKRELLDYIQLLYLKGVEYKVKPNNLFPLRKSAGGWLLYLGGWVETDFCSTPGRIQSAEWKAQEKEQLNEVERMFTELCARVNERDKAVCNVAKHDDQR